eukprot:TRINITY_DN686_c0_g1_i1.p1 TRINITY_DN686_c0_g1~~TRINITY_DN686_c0_g1_i1.p1  ORF type:complete len:192 (+),score=49.79 TRINITY_DN686_c0_g1_i1:246-821(+)
MSGQRAAVSKLHEDVIADVIQALPAPFRAAGYELDRLQELEEIWRRKLLEKSAPPPTEYQPALGQGYGQFNTSAPLSGSPAPYMPSASLANPGMYMDQMNAHVAGANYAPPAKRQRVPGQFDGEDNEVEDPELNSEDDVDDQQPQTNNEVLCQFVKVSRAKQRWKVTLTDGVPRLNGADYVFKKAQCEFDF